MTHGSQLGKTARHTAIYAVGTVLRRIAGLIMLPIYTMYLTPADYGVVELLTMAIEIAGILIGLRISQGMFRFYILADSMKEKGEIASTVLLTIIGTSTFGALLLALFSGPLSVFIFGSGDYTYEFQLFALTLVTNAVTAVGLSYIRARQMPVFFVVIGVVTLLIQIALNILFVVVYELHVTGVVYSAVISGSVIAFAISVYVFINVGIHFSLDVAKRLIRYIAPLMLASIAAFYVAYADKYFLRVFSGLAEVGLYALAARVSAVLITVYDAFNMSWGADRFEIVKRDNAQKVFEQIFRFLSAGVILSGTGLALFANDLFRVMTSPLFYPAGYVVPVLVLGILFKIGTMFCNFGALYRDKTGILAQASWVRAVVATVGYLSLIPLFGMYGAAIVLAISSIMEMVWVHRRSQRLYDMGIRWSPTMIMLICATVVVVAGLMLPAGDGMFFGVRVALYVFLVLLIYKLPLWHPEERELMKLACTRMMCLGRSGAN